MYCFDTDLVISFLRGYPEAINKIKNLQNTGVEIVITYLTLCELYRGAYASLNKEKNISLINEFLERTSPINQSKLSCMLFGQDYAFLKTKGMPTQEMDLMIASICKANNCVLITRNTKDFKNIPNLMIEKW